MKTDCTKEIATELGIEEYAIDATREDDLIRVKQAQPLPPHDVSLIRRRLDEARFAPHRGGVWTRRGTCEDQWSAVADKTADHLEKEGLRSAKPFASASGEWRIKYEDPEHGPGEMDVSSEYVEKYWPEIA
jgi:hypothetical protein